MLYKPELIVYLWLLPVFVLFVVPLLIIPVDRLREMMLAATSQFVGKRAVAEGRGEHVAAPEQRKDPRQLVEGFTAHVYDGVNYYKGAVLDISRSGICFADTGNHFNSEPQKLSFLLTGPEEIFQMMAKPVWHRSNDSGKNIGVSILNSGVNWQEYTNNLEPTRQPGSKF